MSNLEQIKPLFEWTSVRWNKCQVLYDLAKQATGPIVELGAYDGNGTLALGLGSKAGNKVPVYGIDQWQRFTGLYAQQFYPEDYDRFVQNIIKADLSQIIQPIKGESGKVAQVWEKEIALLVWDISLPRLRQDWVWWHKHIKGMFVAKDTTTFDFGWLDVKGYALKEGWQAGPEWPEACLWSVRND